MTNAIRRLADFGICRLINVSGGIMALIGPLGPWFSFATYWDRYQYKGYALVSPFFLSVNVTMLPLSDVITSYSWFFYDVGASLTGFTCIIGAVIGVMGGLKKNPKISSMASFMLLASILAFSTTLPISVGRTISDLSIQWGLKITVLGTILLIVAAFVVWINSLE